MSARNITMTTMLLGLLLFCLACSSSETTLSDEEAQTLGLTAATELAAVGLTFDSSLSSLTKTTQPLDGVDGFSDLKDLSDSLDSCVSSDFGLTSVTWTISPNCTIAGVSFSGELTIDIDVFPTQQIELKANQLSVDGNTLDGVIAVSGSVTSGSLSVNLTVKLTNGAEMKLEDVKATVNALNAMTAISGRASFSDGQQNSAAVTVSSVSRSGLAVFPNSGTVKLDATLQALGKTTGELKFLSTTPTDGTVHVKVESIKGAAVPLAFQCYAVDLAKIADTGYRPTQINCSAY